MRFRRCVLADWVCVSGWIVSLVTGALLQTQHVDVFSLVTWNCRRTGLGRMHVHTHWGLRTQCRQHQAHPEAQTEMQAHANVNRLNTEMQIPLTYTQTSGLIRVLLEGQNVGMLEKKPGGGICWRKTCWVDGGGVRWRSRTLCCLSFLSSARKHYREPTIKSRPLFSSFLSLCKWALDSR